MEVNCANITNADDFVASFFLLMIIVIIMVMIMDL